MRVAFKKIHPNAVLPSRARSGDAGFDLVCVAINPMEINPGSKPNIWLASTGLVLADMTQEENDSSYFLQIEGRSGLALYGVSPLGGIVDSTYRGEIKVILHTERSDDAMTLVGKKVAQLIVRKIPREIEMSFVEDVTETVRGENGFGSSGA